MGKAIVPNYIHSIDASVVHFLACKFDGDVSSIHDCFATQSPLAPKMHQQLTEIYQEIFNSDITERFKGEVAKQTGTDVLACDSFDEGTLDVSLLKDCKYIFS
jgi:DNA-directed RNA polymerase